MAETQTRTAPEAVEELRGLLRKARHQGLRPPPSLSVPEWADEYRVLASEAGSTGGKWRTSRVEVARGPMMAVTEPGVRIITVMSCTQLLKTSFIENVFGYFAHLDPAPILLVQPKDEAVDAFSKERIAPLIKATPALRDLVGDFRAKRSDDTLRFKQFPGGFLAMVSAGSPTNLAMRPIRVTLFDEVDKYEPTKEGDAITLGEERSATFPNNSLSVRACSPTMEETSRIYRSYLESDQRRAYLACPHCDHRQALDFFRHVHWEKDEDGGHRPETAAVHCEACGAAWSEPERLKALRGIQWYQTRPFTCCGQKQDPQQTRAWRWDGDRQVGYAVCTICGRDAVPNYHVGFHAGKLLSPWKPVNDVARKWVDAKDDPTLRQTFYNTQLGLPVKLAVGQEVKPEALAARREVYPAEVPAGALVLTAGIDVQSANTGRFEVEVVAWGLGRESWSIAYEVIEDDLAKPAAWKRLDEFLLRSWQCEDGRQLRIAAACIDSGGHHTQAAYDFSRMRLGRRVWAIKGASEKGARRQPVWPTREIRRTKGKFQPVIIGTMAAKDWIRQRLSVKEPGPGYCHFPADRSTGWFEQLTVERMVYRKAGTTNIAVWECPPGRANEAIDARVYAYAALCGLEQQGLRLDRLAAKLAALGAQPAEPPPKQAQPPDHPPGPHDRASPPAPQQQTQPPPRAGVSRSGRRVIRSNFMMR